MVVTERAWKRTMLAVVALGFLTTAVVMSALSYQQFAIDEIDRRGSLPIAAEEPAP